MRSVLARLLVVLSLARPVAAAERRLALGAELNGPPPLVASVERALAERGVRRPAAGSGAIRVHLVEADDGIRLVLVRDGGRPAERVVANVEIAAAVIESWTRPDLSDPLLAPRRVALARLPTVEPPPPEASVTAAAGAPPGSPVLRVFGETAFASDRSVWMGAGLGGCLTVGRFCVGLVGRFASDVGPRAGRASFKMTTPAQLGRMALEGLATIELPLRLERPLVRVGAGAGIGRLSSEARHESYGRGVATVGPRAEGWAGVAFPVWSRLLVDLELSAALAPLARRDAVEAGYFTLPGEPLGQGRAVLGVRWGQW